MPQCLHDVALSIFCASLVATSCVHVADHADANVTQTKAQCADTCQGHNCDYWIGQTYTCSDLHKIVCNCSGCSNCDTPHRVTGSELFPHHPHPHPHPHPSPTPSTPPAPAPTPPAPATAPTSPPASTPAQTPQFLDFEQKSDDEMRKVTDNPILASTFKCHHENRASCAGEDEAVDAPCQRGKSCITGLFKEKREGPWMSCCQKFAQYEALTFLANALGSFDPDGESFWWSIISGTLLGSMRSEDIIDWTTDIDVIVPKEYEQYVMKRLQNAIAKVDVSYAWDLKGSHEQQDVRRITLGNSGSIIDIFFAHGYHENDQQNTVELHHRGGETRGVFGMNELLPDAHVSTKQEIDSGKGKPCLKFWEYSIPSDWIFPLQNCTIQGNHFPCINGREDFASFIYGPEWKTPDGKKPTPTKAQCSGAQGKIV